MGIFPAPLSGAMVPDLVIQAASTVRSLRASQRPEVTLPATHCGITYATEILRRDRRITFRATRIFRCTADGRAPGVRPGILPQARSVAMN